MRAKRGASIVVLTGALVVAMAPDAGAAELSGQHWTATGDQAGELFGWAVSELEDIDGDGARDAIVGAPVHVNDNGELTGHADVLSGRTGAPIHRFDGAPGDLHGWAIADAGDVDADGVHDVVIGAPAGFGPCAAPSAGPGRAYVYSGASGDELLSIPGEAHGDRFGFSVSGAGDVDEDGHADVLVGAECAATGGTDAGRLYVISGATGAPLRTRDGAPGEHLGSAAALAGDVDGDGVVDHVVGARDGGHRQGGAAYILSGTSGDMIHALTGDATNEEFGTFFVAGVGDLDGDGVPDIYVADYAAGTAMSGRVQPHDRGRAYVFSGATGHRIHVFTGAGRNDGLGPGRSAGDVDGDGTPDLVIGSYTASDGAPFAGKVGLYSGATGDLISEIVSMQGGELLGFDAVGLGDVDDDGRVDLLLSAAGGDTVYVVSS